MAFRRLLVVFALLTSSLVAADLVPVEKFAAEADFSRARLSPDGKSLAFMRNIKGKQWLTIMNLETKKLALVDPGHPVFGPEREVRSFRWISDKRLSFYTTIWDGAFYTGVSAVDSDGKNWKSFSGPDADPLSQTPLLAISIIYAFGDKEANVLMLDRGIERGRDRLFQNVVKVGTYSGRVTTVVQNPGNVLGWSVDRSGVVRLGITYDGKRSGAIYRETDMTPWRNLPPFDEKLGRVLPLGFDLDNRRLLIAADNETKRQAIYYYDPIEGKVGDLIASHATHDIVYQNETPGPDGIDLSTLISSELTGTIIGLRYMTDGPNVKWFDPSFVDVQQAVDRVLPDTVNLITSRSLDEKKLLVFAFSDREPGKYYLLDLKGAAPAFSMIGSLLEKFPTAQMAPMYPIKYSARDGQAIQGYLTLPLGEKKKDFPLVVMPHGGPWVRDTWHYDPWVQFLANRGYAVLQMNYRGSPGYGADFLTKGKREIGRGMQTDIDDGVHWAVAQGIADPKRVAIVGASYGGYSVLFALGNSPELYRCGISFAGVTDWGDIAKNYKTEEYKFTFAHFGEWIGDPKYDAKFLASISPVTFAEKIKAPLLIMQGKEDRIVPPKQARKMIEALERAGTKPRVIYFDDEGHGLRKEKNRLKFFNEIETFLAKNLAPVSGS